MATTLTVRREGTLLPVAINREITEEQEELIQLLLLITDEADVVDLEILKYDFELTRDTLPLLRGVAQ